MVETQYSSTDDEDLDDTDYAYLDYIPYMAYIPYGMVFEHLYTDENPFGLTKEAYKWLNENVNGFGIQTGMYDRTITFGSEKDLIAFMLRWSAKRAELEL